MLRIGNSGNQTRYLSRFNQANSKVNQSLERLSTGKRINHAKDDPSGLIAAEQIRGEITTLGAQQKASDFQAHQQAILQSGQAEIQNVLNEVYGLIVSAADGTISDSQREALQLEVDAAIDAVERIQQNTAKYSAASSGFDPSVLADLQAGGRFNLINGDTAGAQDLAKQVLSSLSFSRASIGAQQRGNEALDAVREDQIINNIDALSSIQDTDFAEEVSNLIKNQNLAKASLFVVAFDQQQTSNALQTLLRTIDVNA